MIRLGVIVIRNCQLCGQMFAFMKPHGAVDQGLCPACAALPEPPEE
jgi:hypothetical protein